MAPASCEKRKTNKFLTFSYREKDNGTVGEVSDDHYSVRFSLRKIMLSKGVTTHYSKPTKTKAQDPKFKTFITFQFEIVKSQADFTTIEKLRTSAFPMKSMASDDLWSENYDHS